MVNSQASLENQSYYWTRTKKDGVLKKSGFVKKLACSREPQSLGSFILSDLEEGQ